MRDDQIPAPEIVSFDGPNQVERGTLVELCWKLSGGPALQLTLNGKPVSGSSVQITVVDDPTRFALVANNAAGAARKEKWIGTHLPNECVSDFVDVTPGTPLSNPRWLNGDAEGDKFAHADTALLEVDAADFVEGQSVRFVIEREGSAGVWSTYQTRSAVAEAGKASLHLVLFHPGSGAGPAASAPPPGPARFRFRAELE